MKYCDGGDLSQYLREEKRFSESKAKFYTCQMLLALDHLHSRDIIYRDLKPENIVLDKQGNSYLTDFGISKEGVQSQCFGAESFCGSMKYMAPEILRQKGHGKNIDWYLLGVLIYEMVVG